MVTKVHVQDTETKHVHEVYAVDAREMLAQEDGRYARYTGKVNPKAVVPPGTPKGRVEEKLQGPQKAHARPGEGETGED